MSGRLPVRRKVVAYIVHRRRLLCFREPDFPEVGIQVPAGTIEPGEGPDEAVRREAREETGLDGLRLVRFLGERRRDMRDYGKPEIHHRYFFELRCHSSPPERWEHLEQTPSEGSTEPIRLAFFWMRAPIRLEAGQGYYLWKLDLGSG